MNYELTKDKENVGKKITWLFSGAPNPTIMNRYKAFVSKRQPIHWGLDLELEPGTPITAPFDCDALVDEPRIYRNGPNEAAIYLYSDELQVGLVLAHLSRESINAKLTQIDDAFTTISIKKGEYLGTIYKRKHLENNLSPQLTSDYKPHLHISTLKGDRSGKGILLRPLINEEHFNPESFFSFRK